MVKNLSANAGEVDSVLASGKSSGEGNGKPLQYYYPGNLMDRGTWWAIVHGGSQRVRHNLAAKQQQHNIFSLKIVDIPCYIIIQF